MDNNFMSMLNNPDLMSNLTKMMENPDVMSQMGQMFNNPETMGKMGEMMNNPDIMNNMDGLMNNQMFKNMGNSNESNDCCDNSNEGCDNSNECCDNSNEGCDNSNECCDNSNECCDNSNEGLGGDSCEDENNLEISELSDNLELDECIMEQSDLINNKYRFEENIVLQNLKNDTYNNSNGIVLNYNNEKERYLIQLTDIHQNNKQILVKENNIVISID
jgi:hypothetical protein